MLLSDREILAEINAGRIKINPPLDLSAGFNHVNSSIQPSSLDLRIGKIYIPDAESDKLGGIRKPLEKLALKPGHTVIVVTLEEIELSNNLAAVGFPPSSVSFQGILMTNHGHVDPGYRGSMRFAVINMGSDPFELRSGDTIVTLLIFRLTADAAAGYVIRNYPQGYTPQPPVKEKDLKSLAADFVEVEKRARVIAKDENKLPTIISSVAGAAAVIMIGLLTLGKDLFINQENWKKPISDLEARLLVLEKSASIETMEKRITGLERKMVQQESVQKKKETR